MKKYKQFINESKFWNNLDDEDLIERRTDLMRERGDLNEQIAYINSILQQRKEERSIDRVKSFPKSIFDLNKNQLDFILEHHHGTDSEHYKISNEYFKQLSGVINTGFNNKTNQFFFVIQTRSCFNDAENDFELDENIIRSIKFLGENLKSENDDGWVRFGVLYSYYDNGYNDKVLYKSENEIKYGRYTSWLRTCQMYDEKSIEELLRSIVENDLSNKDEVDSW